MTQTKKFSQFQGVDLIQSTDIVVGLRIDPETGAYDNWQFNGVGSGGGGGGVTQVILQPMHMLNVGDWVRIDATGDYVVAQADTTQNAEVIGVVIEASDPDMFTLQQSGYIEDVLGVFVGLVPGDPYFLSATNPGEMVNIDVNTANEVSRPVFVPDTPTTGWVVPYRGIIDGGGNATPDSGGGGGDNPNIITVIQDGHGLNLWNLVRLDPANNILMQPVYVRAQADTYSNSLVVGMVIEIINANTFKLQTEGYVLNPLMTDYMGNALISGTTYYLSPTVAGKATSIIPMLFGQISRPVFGSEQTLLTTGVDSGFIFEQRSLNNADVDNNDTHTVVKANTFQKGQWVYIQGAADDTYALAQANTLASSQVAGVIISDFDPNQFTVQQSGWISGAVDGTYVTGALTNGPVLYLSATIAGNLTTIAPTTAGQYNKPCYAQENAGTRTGQILPQRPISATPPAGGGAIIQSVTTTDNVRAGLLMNGGVWYLLPITRSITPQSAAGNLKIVAMLSLRVTTPGNAAYFRCRLLRDGVVVPSGLGTGTASAATKATQVLSINQDFVFTVIDPSIATVLTNYSIEVSISAGANIGLIINGDNTGGFDCTISTLTVEEIA